jgi:hypothetical protein
VTIPCAPDGADYPTVRDQAVQGVDGGASAEAEVSGDIGNAALDHAEVVGASA